MGFNGDIFVQKALRGSIFCKNAIFFNCYAVGIKTGKVIKKQNLKGQKCP